MSKAPEGKTDILIRMDVALKLALAERAAAEKRSLPNLINYIAGQYLERSKPLDAAAMRQLLDDREDQRQIEYQLGLARLEKYQMERAAPLERDDGWPF